MAKLIPKSTRAVLMELRRVERLRKGKVLLLARDRDELTGAMQALAWAVGDNAMAPSKVAALSMKKGA